MRKILSITILLAVLVACSTNPKEKTDMQTVDFISENRIAEVIALMKDSLGDASLFRIERGVQQVASLWRETDGTELGMKRSISSGPLTRSWASRWST
jgi:signal recognition particle receptor subunit beta